MATDAQKKKFDGSQESAPAKHDPGKPGAAKPAVAKKPDPVIYVGPNLSGDILISQFAVFRKIPDYIAKKVKEDRHFARLFVRVNDLASARQQLSTQGSSLARSFQTVLSGVKGVK